MLELVFLSPVVAVITGALIIRYRVKKKPFSRLGLSSVIFCLVAAFAFPLAQGVWIPDFLGQTRTLARTESSTGARFELFQAWNYIDFYTTELRVTQTDGTSKIVLVDGDASKHWSASLAINEDQRTAKAVYSNGFQSHDVAW
jgi:hypothetical protein